MDKVTLQDGQSKNIIAENIQALRALFPDAFTEDGIDFDTLRQLLGDEVAEGEERFGLNWHGKKQARKIALTPSLGTLRPCPEESVDWDTTQNLFIEGDNLEVLKLLQKSYNRKVKMIYIDPPYNTGKDFVYADNFNDSIGHYQRSTGQLDEDGDSTISNKDSSGRYHTNWLNMMYPRLKLARSLLRDDGVIFISIDDYEVDNLRKICDEIFGAENFIANVVWQRAFSPKNDAKHLSENHDYVLIYCKNGNVFKSGKLERTDEANARYKNLDDDPRGVWISDNLTVKTYSDKYDYPITVPSGRIVNPSHGSCWRVSQEKFQELIADNRIWFGKEGNNVPRLKRFLSEVQDGMVATTLWFHTAVGHNQAGRQEVKALFDGKGYFDGPKPTKLLKRILRIANVQENDLVLDFFSGSGSLADATWQYSVEQKIPLHFIVVQLPESLSEKSDAHKDGYTNLADIGKQRLRFAGTKIVSDRPDHQLDIGFKVFKLDYSNLRIWNPDRENVGKSIDDAINNILTDRSRDDVLYELLLKRGIELTVPIEQRAVEELTLYRIGDGNLFACLDKVITMAHLQPLSQAILQWWQETENSDPHVFFRDNAFVDDMVKINLSSQLQQQGITHIRSL